MDKEMYWHMQVDDSDLVIERGIALHKMIRLFTITMGGQAYMNFMGNEFGHPEWIDFPREGNGWSYKYCRRQWSLADDKKLKYRYLAEFDRAMIGVIKKNHLMKSMFAQQLNMDDQNKTIVFERNNLVFLFNFHTRHSIPGYEFRVPQAGDYEVVLSTDSKQFGGHGRVDESVAYPTIQKGNDHFLRIYATNRTAIVLKHNKS